MTSPGVARRESPAAAGAWEEREVTPRTGMLAATGVASACNGSAWPEFQDTVKMVVASLVRQNQSLMRIGIGSTAVAGVRGLAPLSGTDQSL